MSACDKEKETPRDWTAVSVCLHRTAANTEQGRLSEPQRAAGGDAAVPGSAAGALLFLSPNKPPSLLKACRVSFSSAPWACTPHLMHSPVSSVRLGCPASLAQPHHQQGHGKEPSRELSLCQAGSSRDLTPRAAGFYQRAWAVAAPLCAVSTSRISCCPTALPSTVTDGASKSLG